MSPAPGGRPDDAAVRAMAATLARHRDLGPVLAELLRTHVDGGAGVCAVCGPPGGPVPCVVARTAGLSQGDLRRVQPTPLATSTNDDGSLFEKPTPEDGPDQVSPAPAGALITTTGDDVETHEQPIPAPAAAPPPEQPPAALSAEDLRGVVLDLAAGLSELADDITGRRRDPLEAAAHMAIWSRWARHHAGVR